MQTTPKKRGSRLFSTFTYAGTKRNGVSRQRYRAIYVDVEGETMSKKKKLWNINAFAKFSAVQSIQLIALVIFHSALSLSLVRGRTFMMYAYTYMHCVVDEYGEQRHSEKFYLMRMQLDAGGRWPTHIGTTNINVHKIAIQTYRKYTCTCRTQIWLFQIWINSLRPFSCSTANRGLSHTNVRNFSHWEYFRCCQCPHYQHACFVEHQQKKI